MTAVRSEHGRALDSAWLQAAAGRPQLRILIGEAGVGKSWQLEHWRAERPGSEGSRIWFLRRSSWVAELLERGEAWLRQERDPLFVGAARQLAPQLAWPTLAGGAEPPASTEQALGRVFGAVQRVAQRLGSLALILEDVHEWAEAERDALSLLWRRALAGGTPLLLLLSSRPELDPDWSAHLVQSGTLYALPGADSAAAPLTVQPLDPAGTAALCAELLPGAAIPPELPAWVHERSSGHALHAAQLVRFLQDSGVLRLVGPVWVLEGAATLSLPPSLNRLLLANLSSVQADPAAWALVAALAVWDGGATLTELSALLGSSLEHLREEVAAGLTRGHLLAQPGAATARYALGHPLLPALVRSLLPGAQRRALHLRAADVAGDQDRRARHARLGLHPQAMAWTRTALELATTRFDWARAEGHARALLDAGHADDGLRLLHAQAVYAQGRAREAELLLPGSALPAARLLRAEILRTLGQPREALSALGPDEPGSDIQTTLLRAGLLTETAEPQAARDVLEALLEQPLDAPARAAALGDLGRLAYSAGHYQEARQLNVQAAALLDDARHPEQRSLCLNRVGLLSAHLGLWQEAEEALLRSVALLEQAGSAAGLSARQNNLGLLYLQLGRYEEAVAATQRALRLAEIAGEQGVEVDALHNLSNAQFALGQGEAALWSLERAVARCRETGRHERAAGLEFYLADREAQLGRVQRGESLLAAQAEPVEDTYIGATRILLCMGQPAAAWAWLERGGHSNVAGQVNAALLRALCAVCLGHPDAGTWVGQAVQAAARAANPYQRAEAALLEALAGAATPAATALETLARAPGHLRLYERALPQRLAELRGAPPPAPQAAAPASLRTLGAFGLEDTGALRPWRARTVRQLLALLLAAALDERGPSIGSAELKAALWPDASEESAEDSLKITLRRLRQALGDAALIRTQGGRHTLELRRADILVFLRALDGGDPETALAAYQGEFLPQVDQPRVNALREQLRRRWRRAAGVLAAQLPLERAVQLYEQLLADDPLDLSTHLAYLNDLQRRAEFGRVRAVLDAATTTFVRELGEHPPELHAWQRGLDTTPDG